ncbi:hypothetical protein BB558_004034 [Smittium angustum]|uniref:Uncharacterized protein n=1 Tax=Smittium angustum TaxID=133377 RepID=A0A2U1J4B1_SMIAN|nr:hypothetical protein BB558_004034 [Smittium angustum]
MIRELIGGVYFGKRQENAAGEAYDTTEYSVEQVQRVARLQEFSLLIANHTRLFIQLIKQMGGYFVFIYTSNQTLGYLFFNIIHP